MGKIVLWILVGLAAYAAYRFYIISVRRQERSRPPAKDPNLPEVMLKCDHCGVMLPQSEAIAGQREPAKHYCSIEHRRAEEADQ